MTFSELRDALNQVLAKNDIPAVTEAKVTVHVPGLSDRIEITEINLVHQRDSSTEIFLKGDTTE